MFSNRYVRTIILSRVLLQLGIWIRNYAVLLYVSELTNNNPVDVSLISVAEFAPIFLLVLLVGPLPTDGGRREPWYGAICYLACPLGWC